MNLKRQLFVSLFLSFECHPRNQPTLFCVSAAYVLKRDMDRYSPIDAVTIYFNSGAIDEAEPRGAVIDIEVT